MNKRSSILYAVLTLLLVGSVKASIRTQVWDFGAQQLPEVENMLSVEQINSWFVGAEPGAMSMPLLDFTAPDSVNLRFYCHGGRNHKLRTTNMALTHTDEKSLKDADGVLYQGILYANIANDPTIYIEQSFSQGDTIEYVVSSNGSPQHYQFYLSDSSYYATLPYQGPKAELLSFVCPKTGRYRLSAIEDKLVVARIIRHPLRHTLSARETRELRRMSHRPLRHRVERPAYRSDFPDTCARMRTIPYIDTLYVGPGGLDRINTALNIVRHMTRQPGQRVTILIAPGNYEEMLRIDMDDITLKNASRTPSIALCNKGVDIDSCAVRITGYYGHGYNYYSMNSQNVYDPRTLRANRRHHQPSQQNKGGSVSTYWNAVTLVTGQNFVAEHIIFENSFNQYVSRRESQDILESRQGKIVRPADYGNTEVQSRRYRERAAAIAFAMPKDYPADYLPGQHVLRDCRVVSRQDAFYGDAGVNVRVEGGCLMGAVDYIFGGMTLVCIETRLAMLVSSDKNDLSYLTAASTRQQDPGYLFYRCHVTSAIPGVEMADSLPARPGYFGRPWAASAQVLFYETTIDNCLIEPAGWSATLIGRGADRTYEYGSKHADGTPVDTQYRVPWSHVLTAPSSHILLAPWSHILLAPVHDSQE